MDLPNINNFLNNLNESVSMINIMKEGLGPAGYSVIFIENNIVKSFGDNTSGCCGLGHNNPVEEPTEIKELNNIQTGDIIRIANGKHHVLALSSRGRVYTWGKNDYGVLGNGHLKNNNRPELILGLFGQKIIDIRCGLYHSLALTDNGEVFGWGNNAFGQTGTGFCPYPNSIPIKVKGFSRPGNESARIAQIACGYYHSVALSSPSPSGVVSVFGWGRNDNGQLGAGHIPNEIAKKIMIGKNLKIKEVGPYHTILECMNETIRVFGNQYRGPGGCSMRPFTRLVRGQQTVHEN